MRLTLRTLLAYLDDVLDPTDKEELAKKIESSDFARDLVHQTRDSVRRLRLSAPQVIGTGMAIDPNTVAEYLDNALPPEQVGDYERICLESDVHLAETAACHHVLTMVLGEPAEVEPRSRQRMYMIPAEARERRRHRAEAAHPVGTSAAAAPPSLIPPVVNTASITPTVAPKATAFEIPEYLRARPWWQSPTVLGAITVAALVAVAGYFVGDRMGLFGKVTDVAAVDLDKQDSKAMQDEIAPPLDIQAPKTGLATAEATRPEALESDAEETVTVEPLNIDEPSTNASTAQTLPQAATTTPGELPPITLAPPALVSEPMAPPANGVSEGIAPVQPPAATVATAEEAPPATIDSSAATTTTDPALIDPIEQAPGAFAPTTDLAGPAMTAVPPSTGEGEAVPGATPPQYESANTTASATDTTAVTVPVPPATEGTIPLPPQDNPVPVPSSAVSTSEQPSLDAVAIASPPAPNTDEVPSIPGTVPESETQPLANETSFQPQEPVELGTFLSGKTVLLRRDGAKGGWFRVEPRSVVMSGERLLALPEFRPKISLSSGVSLDLSGGTQVILETANAVEVPGLPPASAEEPLINVLYGRIVLINTSNEESRVRLQAGATLGEVRLARNSTLGVEVERPYTPGNDPRTTPSPAMVRMFAPEGGVAWIDGSGEVIVERASRITMLEGGAPEVSPDASAPEWINKEPVVHLSEQRYGAPAIESTLTSDRPADIQLLELFKGRDRREVKSLVTRSSIHADLIAPFIAALGDSEQKWPAWRTQIETLRTAMAQNPESAELVFNTLVEQRGRAAAVDLYEMLCGYNAEQIGTTPDQMKTGALGRLIDWLENDKLDYRVLAVHNLWEITGKQLMPNPAAVASVRNQNIKRWRDRLAAGELVPVK